MDLSLGLTPNDVMLASTPLTFDISGLELLLPLFVGARVAIAQEGAATDVPYLKRLVADGGITIMQATPITWRLLVDSDWVAPAWFKILCGGEALPSRLATELVSAAGQMWNLYGPTETTIWSMQKRLDRTHQQVTIGRAIANTQIYVLDSALRPMPAGAVADLYIAGDGLARGYVGRPGETAESFRPNPFSPDAGARLYRTGDLARYLDDGDIEFRGRSDHQVKIRGVRIETDAISALLTTHPSIRESVTVAVNDAERGAHLAAYVVLRDGASLSHRELRGRLNRHLPPYMIPSAFVELTALPRTSSNKIDRKALPRPNETNYRQAGDIVPARSPIEQAIASIWRDVLLLKDVGAHDDFFELGGNSLQAARLLLRMNERLDTNISMKEFLDAPSIAALAACLSGQSNGAGSSLPPRIERLPRGRFFSLAPQQERWLEQELRTGRSNPNHIQLSIRLTGSLNIVSLEQAVRAVEQRHEALRTSFRIHEDRCVQMVATESAMRIPIVDLSGLPADLREARVARIVRADLKRPFDLRRAPLFRLHCLRLAAVEHALVLCAQHLVCDGWSMEVLTAETADVYRAHVRGEVAPLAPLPIQYVDFAQWQRRWLQTPDFTPHLAYWLRQLTPPPPPLFRHSNKSADDFAVSRLRLRVPGSIFEPAKRGSRELGCSLFTAVVAALTFALHRDAGETDVSIGTMAANRSRTHTENVVGLFTNPIVLRTDLEDAGSIAEIIRRVREVVKDAFIHQELPFEAVVHALEQTRQSRRSDLFQVMMIWQAAPETAPTLPGLRARLCSIGEAEQGIENVPSTIELFFNMRDNVDHLGCDVAYKIRHFTLERVRAIFADFAGFLEKLGLDPDMPSSRPIGTAPQRFRNADDAPASSPTAR
jgi:non-ribosomal peptide synthetase component F/acyl carrier protein